MAERVRDLDPNSGRAVTTAVPGVQDNDDEFFAPLDVAGYNYSPDRYVSDHDRFQDRIIVGTESYPAASFQMWNLSWNHDYVIGDFIWTAIDYIGETGIGSSSFSGDVDQVVSVRNLRARSARIPLSSLVAITHITFISHNNHSYHS